MPGMLRRFHDQVWLVLTCADLETFRAMKGRLPAGIDRWRTLRFRGLPGAIAYRPQSTDVRVVWELFRGDEYAVRGRWPFETVVDCGANAGIFLAWLVRK